MQKKFLSNLAFLVIINLLVKPLWIFGVDREVQNHVGAEEYGLYFALFNFSFLFHIILDFGINNFNNVRIAKDPQLLNKHLSNMLVLKAGLTLVYALITLSIGWWVAFSGYQMFLLQFMILNQVLRSLVLFLRSNISGLHYFRTDAVLSVLDRMLLIVIVGAMLWGLVPASYLTIERFVYAHTLALTITALVAFGLVIHKMDKGFSFTIDTSFLKKILQQTFPFALLGILMSVYNRVDSVMIERLLGEKGDAEAGVYAAAYRLLDAVNMFGFLFASLLMPMFARLLPNKEELVELLQTSYKLIFVLAATVAGTSLIYQNEIMELLYDDANAYWGTVFGLLILSFLFIASIYIFGTLLTAAEKMKHLNIIAVLGVGLNIALNFMLIRQFQALGATLATLITQAIATVLHIAAAYRIFHLRVNYRLIFLLAAYFASILGMAYMSQGLLTQWYYNFAVVLMLSLIIAVAIGLIDLKSLSKMVRSGDDEDNN